ncbi:Gfo/Idh/MocA family protein [Flavicella marina]|uniref:Gfo/Idh/MocA family protein n=1 Tax=Flavicella marina TaxID=1475951 RepID=UPI0012641981|nr:Gfo/Idh/MocA family oxidoreductase [Flavicella marina]
MKTYNWAILGCGKIARKFSKDLQLLSNANLYAATSRNLDKATEFAAELDFEKAYGSYLEMLQDPNVDVVYIATPHSFHKDHALLCMQHKKAVLCEKAFAINQKEVAQMIQSSKENNVFLMEAFWTRFNPDFLKVLDIIKSKELGTLQHVKCDFKFFAPFDDQHRLFNKDLGGGSLLDIGIYPVFTALMTLGLPDTIDVDADLGMTKIDENIEITFKYKNGASAKLSSGFQCTAFNDSEFYFENGAVRISRELNRPMLYKKGYQIDEIHIEKEQGNGYQLEAEHVMDCLDQNLIESPMLPLSFSLDLIKALDKIRNLTSIHYPNDDH